MTTQRSPATPTDATADHANPATPTVKKRAAISRDRVIAVAIELADTQGIGAVSMRKVAASLGVEAMSLYHHAKGKEDILDGMVDAVFAEIPLPQPDVDWSVAMRDRAHAMRTAMSRHPWALPLLDSRQSPGQATLRHHDAVIGCLLNNGFSVPQAALAFSTLDSYIMGFALQESNLPFDETTSAAELATLVSAMLSDSTAHDYPNLTRLTTDHVLQPGYSYAAEFERGLDLILRALAALVSDHEEWVGTPGRPDEARP